MIIGIGTDIVDITTLKQLQDKQPKFVQRILSESEYQQYQHFQSDKRKIEYLAGRYAAKEAFVKALGTGIRQGILFKDIVITNDDQGAPHLSYKHYKVWLSISHHMTQAIAMVVIEDN